MKIKSIEDILILRLKARKIIKEYSEPSNIKDTKNMFMMILLSNIIQTIDWITNLSKKNEEDPIDKLIRLKNTFDNTKKGKSIREKYEEVKNDSLEDYKKYLEKLKKENRKKK